MDLRKHFTSNWISLSLLFVAISLSYSNIFQNQFLFDDEFLLQKNSLIRSWENLLQIFQSSSSAGAGGVDSFYRPLQTLAYLVTYQVAGLSEPAFHTLNLTFHFLNSVLLFFLAKQLKLNLHSATIAALLWAVHPIHTEAVTYMSATADPLHCFFILLSSLLFLSSKSKWGMGASILASLLALLSKETSVVLPALIFCLCLFKGKRLWPALKASSPYWALVALYFLARMTVLNFDSTFEFYKAPNIYTENIIYRFYTFLATLPNYLGVLVFPKDLHMERSFSVYTSFISIEVLLGAFIFFASIYLMIIGIIRRKPWMTFVPLWFFSAHVPHTGVLLPVNSFFLEHWMYVPSISLFLGFALISHKLRPVSTLIIPLMVLTLGFLTFKQNKTWSDPITFYNYILNFEAGTLRVHNNLGMAYSDANNLPKAIEHYKKASEISDQAPQPLHNLGLLHLRSGNIENGIFFLEKAVAVDPNFYHSYLYLAQAYRFLGQVEIAIEYEKKFEATRPKIH